MERPEVTARPYVLFGLAGFLQRSIPQHSYVGIQLAVNLLDAVKVGLRRLHRRDVAGLNQLGKSGCRKEGYVLLVH